MRVLSSGQRSGLKVRGERRSSEIVVQGSGRVTILRK